ncbi:Uncharacterised protein [uncultured archaeon]|nr:Uncharacterised protein [uncultured archaeon]
MTEENGFRAKSKVQLVLEQITRNGTLNSSEFPFLIAKAEEEDDRTFSRKPLMWSFHSRNYFNAFNKLKDQDIDPLMLRFFIRKTIYFRKKATSFDKNINPGFSSSCLGLSYLELAKDIPSIERICFKKGINYLKKAIEEASSLERKQKQLILSYVGQSFLNFYFKQIPNLILNKTIPESDLENLVYGIACNEMSESYTPSRESFKLRSKGYRCLNLVARKTNGQKIIDATRRILDKGSNGRKYFYNYRGGLKEIAYLRGENLSEKVELLTLEKSIKAFNQVDHLKDYINSSTKGNLCLEIGNFITKNEKIIQKEGLETKVSDLFNILGLEINKENKGLDNLAFFAYKKSVEFLEESRKFGNNRRENNSKLGEAYYYLAEYATSIEKYKILFKSIINYGLCNPFHNSIMNYQSIGRQFYNLQHLSKEDFDINPEITPLKIKNALLESINEEVEKLGKSRISKKDIEREFSSILGLLDNSPNLGLELQMNFMENASNAFLKGARAHDQSPDNKSYRGCSMLHVARLNNYIKRYSPDQMREKLEDAENNLRSALEERVKEQPNDLYKDYSRLAECQFRLALATFDISRKNNLCEASIANNKSAKKLLEEKKIKVNPQIYSFIADAHQRLAETSYERSLKRLHLGETIRNFSLAAKAGDDFPENRSKKGGSIIELLKIESRDGVNRENLLKRIKEAKETLEEGNLLNEKRKGHFVYPFVLLYYLSKDIEENQIKGFSKENLSELGLKPPVEYMKDVFKIYSSNKNWAVKALSESANFVFESADNYGLLEDTFILKRGNHEGLLKEMKSTEEARGHLMKIPEKGYLTPKPLDIFDHQDHDERVSGSYYAMSMKKGITLDNFLSNERKSSDEKSEVLKNVIDYLAFIHANIQIETSEFKFERGREDIFNRLNRLKESGISIDSLEISNILSNYSVIEESLKKSLLVFNKDAHPKNWIVSSDNHIVALDFEGGIIPQAYDLVKLLEFGESIDFGQKDELLIQYVNSYNKYKPDSNLDFDKFKLEYLNLTLHKAFTFISGYSKQKSTDWNKNIFVSIENARKSLNYIENNLSSDPRYKNLEISLDNIYQLLKQ